MIVQRSTERLNTKNFIIVLIKIKLSIKSKNSKFRFPLNDQDINEKNSIGYSESKYTLKNT